MDTVSRLCELFSPLHHVYAQASDCQAVEYLLVVIACAWNSNLRFVATKNNNTATYANPYLDDVVLVALQRGFIYLAIVLI